MEELGKLLNILEDYLKRDDGAGRLDLAAADLLGDVGLGGQGLVDGVRKGERIDFDIGSFLATRG